MEYTVYTEKNNIRMFDTSSMNFVDSFGFLLDNFASFPAVVPRTPWPPSSPVWVSSWRLMALCRSEVMAGPLTPIDFPQKKALFNPLFLGGGTFGGEVVLVYNEQRLAIFPAQMSNKVAVEHQPVDALGSLSMIPI